ncbi:MAG: Holliday junction branch migration protein RuvA [Eubacteriaceae bacterium]|nr:Holliday junction branch migration protein RuvA [Eubacteriaceae bacterium]MDD4507878.1 Holliday junction branch migration protein RuvA [Eubacteriaceae bacterium]
MFEYIKGILEAQTEDRVVIDNNGMGLSIVVSLNTLSDLPALHEKIKLLLHPVYREDDITLYGFSTDEERTLFRTLIAISGVGPKAAMGLLSQFTGKDLIHHVVKGDAKAISRAPGIGKKTAERVILELKDQFKDVVLDEGDDGSVLGGAAASLRAEDNVYNEAVNGLLGLGYSYQEAAQMVEKVMTPGMPLETILQKALMSANTLV